MSDKIRKILQKNLNSLFEGDYGFDDMEVAFGVEHKNDNLTDEEENQFGDLEDADEKLKPNYSPGSVSVEPALKKVNKDTNKDAVDYYKDTAKRMKKFQTPNQKAKPSTIGEATDETIRIPKRNAEDSEAKMGLKAPTGTGMEGLRYDDEDTENYTEFEKRQTELNGGDEEGTTYGNMKKAGKDYKEYKYGDKFDKVENDYHDTPKVRTTTKENIEMKYSDVEKENIFKTKGKIVSEEQVIKVASKIPARTKIDETVFAITDGDNYYRLVWEGAEDGEAIITHHKNKEIVTESVDKMKYLWNFNASDSNSTKKNVSEGNEDIFRTMLDKMRNSDGLMGNNE